MEWLGAVVVGGFVLWLIGAIGDLRARLDLAEKALSSELHLAELERNVFSGERELRAIEREIRAETVRQQAARS
jgi:hypothetical protein